MGREEKNLTLTLPRSTTFSRITVAHQQETNDSFAAYASTRRKSHAEAPVVTEDEIAKLLSNGGSTTTPGHNMEDLTGEVQDLMMRCVAFVNFI